MINMQHAVAIAAFALHPLCPALFETLTQGPRHSRHRHFDISNKDLFDSVLENVWKGALFYSDSVHVVTKHLSSKTFRNLHRFYWIIRDEINSAVRN